MTSESARTWRSLGDQRHTWAPLARLRSGTHRSTEQARGSAIYPANSYAIRRTTDADEPTLRRLAELDSQRPLEGPALIGEIRGLPAAAVSLTDGRVIADPFKTTVHLRQILRMRADAFRAFSRTPSLSERLRAGIRTVPATRTATT